MQIPALLGQRDFSGWHSVSGERLSKLPTHQDTAGAGQTGLCWKSRGCRCLRAQACAEKLLQVRAQDTLVVRVVHTAAVDGALQDPSYKLPRGVFGSCSQGSQGLQFHTLSTRGVLGNNKLTGSIINHLITQQDEPDI